MSSTCQVESAPLHGLDVRRSQPWAAPTWAGVVRRVCCNAGTMARSTGWLTQLRAVEAGEDGEAFGDAGAEFFGEAVKG